MDGPHKPLLIFDGDCSFCRLWIVYWQQLTGDRVDYRPFQEAKADYPDIPYAAFEKSVQLILPDGSVLSAAHAVFRVLAEPPNSGWLLGLYDHLPGFAPVSEWVYARVAAHRDLSYRLTAWLIGKPAPDSFRAARWLFMRAIGLVYLAAFASMIPQIAGLLGQNGILPVGDFLGYLSGGLGPRAVLLIPTVFWVGHSDAALVGAMIAGAILAILVVVGVAQRPALIGLYVLYLSLFYVGQDFMSFQWDILLLEAGFLAIFLAPPDWRPRLPIDEPEPPRAFIWLVWWLLFRLMFGSGFVKLASGDPTWHSLTALDYHFYTQPLPTPAGWLAAQLPSWAHLAMTAVMFTVELGAPFLILTPRRLRFLGGYLILSLQFLIALTGNYTFFNFLTMALCIPLFDDQALSRLVPARLRLRLIAAWQRTTRPAWKQTALRIAALTILVGSGSLFADQIGLGPAVPDFLVGMGRTLSEYGVTNTYGLFAVMTTTRTEIIIEGSNDQVTWLPYELPFKPGDVWRVPAFVAPYQPRLDWQMWFAALGDAQQNPWFENLLVRLLQGSPEVTGLFAHNPFPDAPPKYIRARTYDYRFTTIAQLSQTGAWWVRTETAPYFPAVSIDQFH